MTNFLILGNANAITYKEIFPYIKNNQMWLGNKPLSCIMDFVAGNNYDASKCKSHKTDYFGNNLLSVMMCTWFTNIPHSKNQEPLQLTKIYSATNYHKYNNYNAIDVSKVKDIPIDYDGVMGVPITFLDKYCNSQFEIVGCADADIVPNGWNGMSEKFVELYFKQGNKGHYQVGNILAHYIDNNGIAKVPYKRLLIKRI